MLEKPGIRKVKACFPTAKFLPLFSDWTAPRFPSFLDLQLESGRRKSDSRLEDIFWEEKRLSFVFHDGCAMCVDLESCELP